MEINISLGLFSDFQFNLMRYGKLMMIRPYHGRVLDIDDPAYVAMINNYFMNDVIAQRMPFDKEYRISRNDDKKTRWVHGLGKLTFDPEGNVKGIIGTTQDITERKQAEEAQAENELKYRSLFETADDAESCCSPAINGWTAILQQ